MSVNLKNKKKFIFSKGYKSIYKPMSVRSYKGLVHEHIAVMEKYLNRSIPQTPFPCVIHHINEIKKDNRIENLILLPCQEIHDELHRLMSSRQESDVKKYIEWSKNFMENLKTGSSSKESIPTGFLICMKRLGVCL